MAPVQRSAAPDAHADTVEGFRAAQRAVLRRYGVAAESRLVDLPTGERVHVLVAGDGPPLFMVIGATVPAAFWAPLMPQLREHTLYAMDLPGFGLSDPVAYRSETLRTTAVAVLAGVLDGLGIRRCPFVTHSMGSLWTSWLSIEQPDRVAARVQIGCPAMLLGTSAPLPMRILSIRSVGRLLTRLQRPSPRQVERVFAVVGEDVAAIPEIRDVLLACEQLPGYGPAVVALMNAVMRFGTPRAELALTGDQLARIHQPQQLIWGDQDPFGSVAVGRRAAELLPDAQLHVIPGGHAPWLNRPEQVGDLATQFLDQDARRNRLGRPGRLD